MATRTTVTLVDDLDGDPADETVPFGLDGTDYEIDLSSEHAEELRGAIKRYIASARRTGGRRSSITGASSRTQKPTNGASRERNQEVRAWALSNGAALSDRGRVPGYVLEAFEAGDASSLSPGSTNAAASWPKGATEAPASEHAETDGAAEQPRGRDGLTTSERETIRAWAVDEGIEVKARGMLKKDLVANYEAWSARQS